MKKKVWILVAWIVPFIYPQVPSALFSAGQTMEQSLGLGLISALAVIIWGVAGPVASFSALSRSSEEERSRSAIYGAVIATVTPPLFAFTGVIAFMAGLPQYRNIAWYAFITVCFALAWVPLPAPKLKVAPIKKLHRWCAIPIALFVGLHLMNALPGVVSLGGQKQILLALRSFYRLLPIEVLLLASVALLVVSGVLVAFKSLGKGDTKTLLNTLSGLYLAAFLLAHLVAVFILGRSFLQVDTNFIWASGGESGLIASPYYTQLAPYYFLAVIAFFIHFGQAVVPVLMKTDNKETVLRRSKTVSALGGVFAIFITVALCGFHLISG